MKRKLIDYEVFNKMRENSLTTAVKELIEAEEHLARSLNVDELKLSSFNESTVIYEQTDGSYLRANYTVDKDKLHFDDVEQLVIDEESEKTQARSTIRSMVEAILDDKEVEANKLFDDYMQFASKHYQRECQECSEDVLQEGYARLYGGKDRTKDGKPRISYRSGAKDPVKVRAAKKAHQRHKGSYAIGGRKRKRQLASERSRRSRYKPLYTRLRALSGGQHYTGKRKKMTEWLDLANNVYGYIDIAENGHVLSESAIKTNEDGTLSVSMPNAKARNEGKLLKMHFDNMLKTDVKVLRENARRLIHDPRFCQAVSDVKRYNNISDNAELEESIGTLVKNFPSVLYLTQEELAHVVGLALDNVGVTNYDDQTCRFMSEGILRMAHEAYVDRVDRIKKLANKSDLKESDDKYQDFQKIVTDFFPTLDESTHLEMKMFEDLYNVASDIRKIALESENEVVRGEATEFIEELEQVLNGRTMPNLELAAEVAGWLEDLAEGNLPGASDTWNVVKTPHKTITGDHPQMAKNAKVPGVAGQFTGDWGDSAPMIGQDSNAWNHGDEARNRSWANKGGKDVWPTLQNPVTPKPFGDYKMKGEKSVVDDDNNFGTWQDGETWPNLSNPYCPASLIPLQKIQPDNRVD